MKRTLGTIALAGLAIAAAHAQGEGSPAPAPRPAAAAPVSAPLDWTGWTGAAPVAPAPAAAAPLPQPATPSAPEPDVVDAHWMALTMWGEARGQGEEAMRAVGHVIDNRRRTGAHGAFVTDTVAEAFQFSCWNEGDPNRAAMAAVPDLPEGRERRAWLAARRIADEILAGRSADPTGGALFYHSRAVAPAWSRGQAPVALIGAHLFFRTAAKA